MTPWLAWLIVAIIAAAGLVLLAEAVRHVGALGALGPDWQDRTMRESHQRRVRDVEAAMERGRSRARVAGREA